MNRSFRVWRLALLVCACLCARVSPALAQSDTGEIIITVVDANSKSPLVDARTILIGPQTASSLTTKAGVIHYTDVPTGIYRVRVVKRGFDSGASKEFDVLEGRSVSVRVELSTSTGGLKIIGSVTARSNVSVSNSDINDNSPIRRISNSLTDALDTIAGVSVTQDATDPSSPVTVSLTNHDESQTAITLDGIPLSAPGTSANLRGIGTDLFSGSSVSGSPSAGALGGGVNFRTLQPTQALQFRGSGTTGTFDRSNYSLAATGSVDSLGFAVQHTWRGSNNPLTFRDYEDQSGLTYPHEGESTSLGDYVKFRYRLGDDRTSISGTALSNNLDASAICARDVTLLPCGIGPGNQNYGRFGFAYTTVQSLIGTVATTASAYTSSSVQTNDDTNRYVLVPPCDIAAIGQAACDPAGYTETLFPSLSTNDTLTRGFAYSSSISQGRHTLALSGNTYASINTSLPIAGSKFEVPYTNAISSTSYTLSDNIKSSDKITLQPRVSIVNTTTLGTSALAGFGATWAPQSSDTFTSSINVGSSQPNININRSYSDPVSARFDCQARTAIVSGPGDTNGGSQSAVSLDAAWTHRFASGNSLTADFFSQVQTGQLITALIAEPASYYSPVPGYLTDLAAAYASPNVCGAGNGIPAVYAQESVGGTRRIYQGVNINGRFGLGRYVVAIPTYSLNKAELTAASGRLQDGPSTTLVGSQLPNRPLHRAGLTVDGYLPRSGIELIGNAQYTGSNNQQNLGPYVSVSGGISHVFGPGQVTLFENNIFNTYGGVFATDEFASPLPLSSGGVFRTAATPLVPRTVNLSYVMTVGGPRPGPALASIKNIAQATPEPTPNPSASPGRNRFVPVPPPPGVDPLSLATSRPECDATQQATAKPLSDALRAYVTAYAAKTKLPDVEAFTIVPHVATVDPTVPYYLELRPRRPQGAANRDGAAGDPGGFPRAGRFGGGGGGGERQPGGGGSPGGGAEGPPPGEGGPPGGNAPGGEGAGAPTDAQRAAFRNSPQALAFRAFTSCAYVSVFTADQAKAKGIVPQGGRPGLFYVPGTGLTFVRPPELPQGGGSLKR